ncbi:MAG TPA: hypothetical protein DDY72_04960 [Verrucomicrobia bacterium]|nr:hypothetical protein [Verrucomicrobiota bacterium]
MRARLECHEHGAGILVLEYSVKPTRVVGTVVSSSIWRLAPDFAIRQIFEVLSLTSISIVV